HAENDGIATLEKNAVGRKLTVETKRLDSLGLTGKIRLIKIDVEGHELSVLKGAQKALEDNLFDYILYEDLTGPDGETTKFLRDRGYTIFKLVKAFSGLLLTDPHFPHP